MSDNLAKLFFGPLNCRGEVLHLDESWQDAVAHQKLPYPVMNLLGEMTAGALLLAACLKYDGALVLQLQGDGPVRLAIVEVRTGLVYRATAQLRVPVENIDAKADFRSLVNVKGGGRCAVILDMTGRPQGVPPYQGVVGLDGGSVAKCLEEYMTRSEQLKTRLWLAADSTAVGGVMLQKIPATGGKPEDPGSDAEGIDKLALLAATVEKTELLGLPATETARRLFWEDNPRVTAQLTPTFSCRCTQQGIENMIKRLGKQEAEETLKEQGKIEVTCQFCGKRYTLDKVDVERIFANEAFASAPATQTRQ